MDAIGYSAAVKKLEDGGQVVFANAVRDEDGLVRGNKIAEAWDAKHPSLPSMKETDLYFPEAYLTMAQDGKVELSVSYVPMFTDYKPLEKKVMMGIVDAKALLFHFLKKRRPFEAWCAEDDADEDDSDEAVT